MFPLGPRERAAIHDLRAKLLRVVAAEGRSTEVTMAALLNTLGAVIAHGSETPADRLAKIEAAMKTLPGYVGAYARGENPLT